MKCIRKVALLLDGSRSFDRGLLRGIARYVDVHQPWACLRPAAFYQRFSGLVQQTLEEIQRAAPDGIIVNYSPLGNKLLTLGVPVIVVPVDRILPGAHYIMCDNHETASLAAEHLAGLGLQHFAFAGFARAIWSLERRDAFCRHLARRGFQVNSHLVPLSAHAAKRARHEAASVEWLRSLPKPVGILACNDEFARSLAELCRIHGLQIPDEIALIGVDNDELICTLNNPPLSSVSFAVEQAGYEAAEMLDQLMDGHKVKTDKIVVHAGQLVARQSTDIMAITDTEVVKALRFVNENAHRAIRVEEVVETTLLSHRMLNYRFQDTVGHSLVKEINRRRAAHIAGRLVNTNDPIAGIARSMGFDTSANMARFFQREIGMTPRAYRAQRQSPCEPAG